MARLSWNEIETRAEEFATRWAGETYERGESQSFWTQFLEVFGVDRRRHGAFFEYAIKKTGGKQGFIDLFWPGKLIVEQKSAGRDLSKARTQAYDYLPAMPDHDLPQAIVVCDFQTFEVLDTASNEVIAFPLADLPKRVRRFAFLIDETTKIFADEDPVNRRAAERMAELHNQLEANRYKGHDLELLLVRLVFCLFADDARIFERDAFGKYLRERTKPDGSDLGPLLVGLFEVLNTPEDERQTNLDQDLAAFPYINGGLFEEAIRIPQFNSEMRHSLLTATHVDWGKVSPAIFGSMFQSVMDETERRNLGAHYTSEKNILRLIQPLFLDDLYTEFERAKRRRSDLEKFHRKLSTLTFLDPACGCGNFLVITYRELRRLEHKVVAELYKGQQILDLPSMLRVNVNQMYGIEIEEFPARIAQTALWLTDHQMNMEATQLLGQTYVRLPLIASARVVHANALRLNWEEVVSPERLSYILGNPPFIGHQYRNSQQVQDMNAIWGSTGAYNRLDYVTCWYKLASDFMEHNPSIKAALVATNSICQGEQVRPLWKDLFSRGISIRFAHRTFQWTNDARGVAAVHCVIVGFERQDKFERRLFEYPSLKSEPIEISAKNINGYLVDAPNIFISSRTDPPAHVPLISKGSQPTDGGNLILTPSDREAILAVHPDCEPYIRRYMGGKEFLNGQERYCLWLKDASPVELQRWPEIARRLEAVRSLRLASPTASVREFARYPMLFTQDRQPDSDYLAIPEVSSERRDYLPVGYVDKSVIASNQLQLVREPNLFVFAVMSSSMYMAWLKTVAGRLKSDFRHTPAVYSNFPWPQCETNQRDTVGAAAIEVMQVREQYSELSLASLYNSLTMPPILRKSHEALDRVIDRLYRKKPFASDAERVAHLFTLYQELTRASV